MSVTYMMTDLSVKKINTNFKVLYLGQFSNKFLKSK